MDEPDEWDGPWKEAMECLDLVFDLFWPDMLDEIDLNLAYSSLEQELQRLAPESNSGLLRVDKLFAMTARETEDPRYAHFEVQMSKDLEFPWRMFRYARRGGEYFNQPIARFAILGDTDPKWKPTMYREGVSHCEDNCTFRVVKLIEWRPRMAELEAGKNLLGLFVVATLETMSTKRNVPDRQEAKFRLLSNLLRREISEDELRRWYRLIDWIMKLPEDINRAVWLRLQELKEPKTMSHVTFAEKYGIEKGRTEELKESLREMLLAKFPQQGTALVAEFAAETNLDRLRALLRTVGLANSLEDFRTRIAPSSRSTEQANLGPVDSTPLPK